MIGHRIAAIPGDGIGREVLPAAQRVLDAAASRYDVRLSWEELPWSCAWYAEHGAMMPADGIDRLRETDAIFVGAIGHPRVPDHVSLWGLLIPIRRAFDQYVNLRPARLLPGLASPLRDCGRFDVAIVRENTEGEYSDVGGRFATPAGDVAVQESIFTRRGCERVLRYAFALARSRGGRLISATKSNGIMHTMPFWDEVTAEVAAEHPDVEWRRMHVDALAARFITDPEDLDVVVGSNLFGDILSDLAAAVSGSLGVAPSANLDPTRENPSMFEPVHGSAPDIAGRGVANPIAQVWCGAMMLEHLGHPEAAADVLAAIETVTADPVLRTRDLGGKATTKDVTSALVDVLAKA
ncbi:tartrate dehydrogenase [Actinomadura sp. DC4]|uniref:tartrate dehydrogenase n=1 Tax=Actinomadura sp. DC4 TaxID=3055069 RepID=UPI0025B073DE|nr:tartrate dehydrogenase [Actinomadura sp. DC4]MDN3354620.1 tartrate dehydrogenase [Actinomadura sp. DC4]